MYFPLNLEATVYSSQNVQSLCSTCMANMGGWWLTYSVHCTVDSSGNRLTTRTCMYMYIHCILAFVYIQYMYIYIHMQVHVRVYLYVSIEYACILYMYM